MKINSTISAKDLQSDIEKCWDISGEKIRRIETDYDTSKGAPVFTVAGKYSSRGWTEWTQGFQYGSAVLQFDAQGMNIS